MRSEQEMFELILAIARRDARIRAVILNGSRANPQARGDIFQDYDIVYIVTDIASFKQDPNWIKCFGELMILQLPDDMSATPHALDDPYAYLMQFADGNRIDLSLFPLDRLNQLGSDSLSVLLLDKDGIIQPFAPPNQSDYLPSPPTAQEYADCCNEFWWVSPYVAKGLWREELTYAKCMFDLYVREELMKMLTWYIGLKTRFLENPGKLGKYYQKYLEPELWEMLQKTYADAGYENNWKALFSMCDLFRFTARAVGRNFGFAYPQADDQRVSAHLQHVRRLPKNATQMY